jgi:hypothetical protein
MNLKPLVIQNVARAFQIASDFTPLVTFQMEIVWNINPVNDTEARTATVTRTVPAVQWNNIPVRNDLGYLTFTEQVIIRQWTDIPGPTDNDLMVDPDGVTRQIEKVNDDPAHACWVITLRGATAQT